MVALDGNDDAYFFVAGGWTGSRDTNKAFVYKGSQWVGVSNMPTARRGKKPRLHIQNEFYFKLCLAGLVCGPVRVRPGHKVDKVVAAGGASRHSGDLSKVEIYDVSRNTWVTGKAYLCVLLSGKVVLQSKVSQS